MSCPSFADPPFACPPDPIEIVLDLPFPTSTNRLHKTARGHVYRTKEYEAWIKDCDATVMLKRQYPRTRLQGPFEIEILLSNQGRGDGDNRIKAVLDYLQSREITGNDLNCRRGSWAWVSHEQAPCGCCVTVRELNELDRGTNRTLEKASSGGALG
jgi:Holliday junction resolvase RusA-like endonuclease